MINLFHSTNRQCGAVTLFTAIILLLVSSIIILFAARYGSMQNQTSSNIHRNQQAFQAAEAGLEFGINYFKSNATAIIGTPVSGYIQPYSNASITNVTLANGSSFSINYSNPNASDYTLIKITATGTSADGTATRITSVLIKQGSTFLNPGNTSLVTKGSVNMSGNAEINNNHNPISVNAAGSVNMSGNAETNSSTGSSDSHHTGPDLQQNDSVLANTSQSDFIANYFGTSSSSTIKNQMAHVYTNTSSTNYSNTLNGMQGTSIYIEQTGGTASINGNAVIGSATNPVLLVVNGGLSLSGNITFYGFIFIIGTSGITSTTGNINVIGGIASVDDLTMSGNSDISYDQTVLTNLQNSLTYYAKVPGSWKDF